jgi:2-polyprenyl-3-methyl-5-hydroxy-6-metoxy-1,4-benzoquinol methylase
MLVHSRASAEIEIAWRGASFLTQGTVILGTTTYSDREHMETSMDDVCASGGTVLECLICGGEKHRPIFCEFGIDILRCQECHHVFSSFSGEPHYDGFWGEEVGEGDHYYWDRARREMHQDFFRQFIDGRSGRLLDMGCGLGFFMNSMATYRNWDVYGCEISPAAVRFAREKLGLEKVICGRLEECNLPKHSFDIITMWDVLEHIPKPDMLIRRCHELLKEGGMCFIRTPNVAIQLFRARLLKLFCGIQPNIAYMQGRHHIQQYSVSSVRRLMERNGFSGVQFVHLHPIQSGVRGANVPVSVLKNLCFRTVRALAIASNERWNFDNLFVVAHKSSQ